MSIHALPGQTLVLASAGTDVLAVFLLLVGVGIWIGWPIQAHRQARDIVESHTRLGYLIADVTIVAPLCLASGYALLEGYRWGPLVLLLAIGAGAYDLTHFLVYLGQRGIPKVSGRALPWYDYAIAIVVVLVLLGALAWHYLHRAATATGVQGSGLYVTLILVLVGAAISSVLTWRLLRPPFRS
jgi:hypothetical protein